MKTFLTVLLLSALSLIASAQSRFDERWASAVRTGSVDSGLEASLSGLRNSTSANISDRARASFFYARLEQHKAEVSAPGAASLGSLVSQARSAYQFAISNGVGTVKASAATYLSLLEVLASGANGAITQAKLLTSESFEANSTVELDCSMWTIDQRYRILQAVPMSQFKPILIAALNGVAKSKSQFRDALLESVASTIADYCRKNPGRSIK